MSVNPPAEWNAGEYHRLSDPQFGWGLAVLERLPLRGDETVLDAGCGSGRVTAHLLERLPRGRVIAADRSRNMLAAARALLAPRFGARVTFVELDLQEFTLDRPVDVVFSTATFHWVLDHPRLFRTLHRALVPGGRLHAQCGGGPNVARLRARADVEIARPEFRASFAGFTDPWEFADAATTAARLAAAGYTGVRTWLESAPVVLPDRDTYRAFLSTVTCARWLERLDSDALRERFLDRFVAAGATDEPPWSLDYVRLNLEAVRPAESA